MLKIPSLSVYDTEFWHKVRLHQTYTWPVEGDEGCNAAECDEATDHYTTGHILWRCSRSRQLWKRLFGRCLASCAHARVVVKAIYILYVLLAGGSHFLPKRYRVLSN
jgi:hypothetical protein